MKLISTIIISCLIIATIFCTGYINGVESTNIDFSDYQVYCGKDSIKLWDNDTLIGTLPYDSSKFSLLILNDNE